MCFLTCNCSHPAGQRSSLTCPFGTFKFNLYFSYIMYIHPWTCHVHLECVTRKFENDGNVAQSESIGCMEFVNVLIFILSLQHILQHDHRASPYLCG